MTMVQSAHGSGAERYMAVSATLHDSGAERSTASARRGARLGAVQGMQMMNRHITCLHGDVARAGTLDPLPDQLLVRDEGGRVDPV
jgi:hypothetical protein